MSGICGWVNSEHNRYNAQSVLDSMASTLPPLGSQENSRVLDDNAIYARLSHSSNIFFNDNRVLVAIDGTPHWTGSSPPPQTQQEISTAQIVYQAYRSLGIDFLKHLHGHFALVLIDRDRNLCLLAVDRMGVRPLCYSIGDNDMLAFGSTTKSVRRHPAISGSINTQGLFDYLYFHAIPAPTAIFQHIKKLGPAERVVYEQGRIRVERYWAPKFQHANQDFPTLKNQLRETLRAAVARSADGESGSVGAFLSGGIDSSTVSGLLSEISDSPVQTYTIGFSEPGYDELEFARIAASHFATELHDYYVTAEDVAAAIPQVAGAFDEPFGNSSAIPALFCARLARENGTRVMLAGDGGDELFGGNTRYVTQKIFGFYERFPKLLRDLVIDPAFYNNKLSQMLPLVRKINRYIEQAKIPLPARTESYNFLSRNDPRTILHPDFLAAIDLSSPAQHLESVYAEAQSVSELDRLLYLDWKFTLADNDLRKVVRTCEIAGIEVRFPILDDEVVEFSTTVPSHLKIKQLRLRYFFKEALKDFLPMETIKKSKHGFGLPFGQWLKKSPLLQDFVYDSLNSLKSRHIVDPVFLDGLIDSHRSGHAAYYGSMLWVLMMLEQWFQTHSIGNWDSN